MRISFRVQGSHTQRFGARAAWVLNIRVSGLGLVLGYLVFVNVVQVLGKYLTIGHLDPWPE